MRPALTTLLALSLLPLGLLLSGCSKRTPDDLGSKVMFTAAGSYDASADVRKRLGRGLRRVTWNTHPPLAAGDVSVDYNSDARPVAWIMTIHHPSFSAEALATGAGQKVNMPDGPGLLPTQGRLKNVLIVQRDGALQLITRGYAAQQKPELLPSFRN